METDIFFGIIIRVIAAECRASYEEFSVHGTHLDSSLLNSCRRVVLMATYNFEPDLFFVGFEHNLDQIEYLGEFNQTIIENPNSYIASPFAADSNSFDHQNLEFNFAIPTGNLHDAIHPYETMEADDTKAILSSERDQIEEIKFSPENSGICQPKRKNTTKASSNSAKRVKVNDVEAGNCNDVVHVRARRGQATDSHSIAERARRSKINQRLKFLRHIVPGCYKHMGMTVMLDEIINYVQSLKNQVEFLSMKISATTSLCSLTEEKNVINYQQDQIEGYQNVHDDLFPIMHMNFLNPFLWPSENGIQLENDTSIESNAI